MQWCGLLWCVVWSHVWCGLRCVVQWCGLLWCVVQWCGLLWCVMQWCGLLWCVVQWCGLMCGVVSGVLCSGVQWCGLQLTLFMSRAVMVSKMFPKYLCLHYKKFPKLTCHKLGQDHPRVIF